MHRQRTSQNSITYGDIRLPKYISPIEYTNGARPKVIPGERSFTVLSGTSPERSTTPSTRPQHPTATIYSDATKPACRQRRPPPRFGRPQVDPGGRLPAPTDAAATGVGQPRVTEGCPAEDVIRSHTRSNRSRFMTLCHAAAKSCTNFSWASADP